MKEAKMYLNWLYDGIIENFATSETRKRLTVITKKLR